MTKKIHKLNVPLEIDFYIIGIVSSDSDYRLCWQINSTLNIKLAKVQNIVLKQKQNIVSNSFSTFSYEDEELYVKYTLIKNKNQSVFFITERKNFDYFLKIAGELTMNEIENMIASLRSIPEVNIATNIVPSELKSINNFLF